MRQNGALEGYEVEPRPVAAAELPEGRPHLGFTAPGSVVHRLGGQGEAASVVSEEGDVAWRLPVTLTVAKDASRAEAQCRYVLEAWSFAAARARFTFATHGFEVFWPRSEGTPEGDACSASLSQFAEVLGIDGGEDAWTRCMEELQNTTARYLGSRGFPLAEPAGTWDDDSESLFVRPQTRYSPHPTLGRDLTDGRWDTVAVVHPAPAPASGPAPALPSHEARHRVAYHTVHRDLFQEPALKREAKERGARAGGPRLVNLWLLLRGSCDTMGIVDAAGRTVVAVDLPPGAFIMFDTATRWHGAIPLHSLALPQGAGRDPEAVAAALRCDVPGAYTDTRLSVELRCVVDPAVGGESLSFLETKAQMGVPLRQ